MKKWIPVMVISGVAMGVGAFWFHTRPYDAARLVQCLPPDRSLHVYLDVSLLRSTGLLQLIAGSPVLEEASYKQFVEETGFNYREDLDAVAIAFRDGDRYYAIQGRFDRKKLAAYAENHDGKCDGIRCSLPGSAPGLTTSFYMIRNDVLALASSRGPTAGDMVAPGTWNEPPPIPTAALWVSAPPYVFANPAAFPTGTRSFLEPLSHARATYFTLGPGDKGYALKMNVTTDTPQAAASLAKDLMDATDLLARMLDREKMTANPADLSGVLVGGTFEAKDARVNGTWPIAQDFVESLAGDAVAP